MGTEMKAVAEKKTVAVHVMAWPRGYLVPGGSAPPPCVSKFTGASVGSPEQPFLQEKIT